MIYTTEVVTEDINTSDDPLIILSWAKGGFGIIRISSSGSKPHEDLLNSRPDGRLSGGLPC